MTGRKFRACTIVVAVCLMLMTACSGAKEIRINGAQVDSEAAFLSGIEQQWREMTGQIQYKSMAPQTSCWALRQIKTGDLKNSALCGPVRYLGNPSPGVFDEIGFQPQLIGDKQVAVDPKTIRPLNLGVDIPEGYELYRPGVEPPVAADQVPMPKPPSAAADAIGVFASSELTIKDSKKPKAGVIRIPGNEITVTEVGRVDQIPPSKLERTDQAPFYAPSEGHEFLTITLDPGNNATLRGSNLALSIKSSRGTQVISPTAGTPTVVISTPIGEDPTLVVGYDGLDQTVSVRTGERTSTTAAVLYREKLEVGVNKQAPSETVTNGDFKLTVGITFTDIRLDAYWADGDGWAPEGYMWAFINYDGVTYRSTMRYNINFNAAESIKVTSAGGNGKTEVKPKKIEDLLRDYSSKKNIVALVPEGSKSISVTWRPSGTFTGAYGYETPKSGSFTTKPLTFEVSI